MLLVNSNSSYGRYAHMVQLAIPYTYGRTICAYAHGSHIPKYAHGIQQHHPSDPPPGEKNPEMIA